jgi:hypothetical protein
MIIWLASYPKSGNTWLRSLLCSYFFSKNGIFNFKQLENIQQFSSRLNQTTDNKDSNYQNRVSKNWISTQEFINKDKKIHLMKTHNAMCTINGNSFTNKYNTRACIYIVRDPRNVVTSISNHYNLGLPEALDFIKNKKKIIFPEKKILGKKNFADPKDFNFISSWSDHYSSWKNISIFPIMILKYEDLEKDTNKVFLSTLKFLSNFMKFDIDNKRVKNCIDSTNFETLKQMEDKEGFNETPDSFKGKNEKRFFHLGKKNNWRVLLDKKVSRDIEENFKREMKFLGYL